MLNIMLLFIQLWKVDDNNAGSEINQFLSCTFSFNPNFFSLLSRREIKNIRRNVFDGSANIMTAESIYPIDFH